MPLRSLRIAGAALLGVVGTAAMAQQASTNQVDTSTVVVRPDRTVKTGPAQIIDTTKFDQQIVKTFDPQKPEAENPYRPSSWKDVLPANNLPLGGLMKEHRKAQTKKWPAIGATGWVPPDPTLAVGKTNVVVTVNSSLAFYTRTGTQQLQQTFATFFGLPANTFLYDPKVYYDKIADRFFVVILEEDDATQISRLRIAVSDDGDPNGTWFKYVVDSKYTVGSDNFWLDYPGFGYNKDAIVITGNMFNFVGTGTQYAGVQYQVIPKAALLTGAPATVTYLHDPNTGAFSQQMAEIGDSSVTNLYGISSYNTGNLRSCVITNPATSPTITFGFLAVPSFTWPSNYAVSKNSRQLDPSDGRLLNASWQDGHLLTSGTVRTAGDATNRVRWYDVTFSGTTAVLDQSGEVASPTSGEHYIMPAASRNAYGDTTVIFTRCSTNIVADLMYSARLSSDPAGTMGTPFLLKSSDGTFYGSGTNRWGDYFQVNVDPLDNNTFWGVGMVGDANGNWKTHVYSWSLLVPLSAVSAPGSLSGGAPGQGTVTLAQVARPGGADVTLTSSDPAHLSVPATVNVPAGSTSANFNFTTTSVSSATTVTITAVAGGVTKTTNVTLNPGGIVSGTVGLQDFGGTVAGTPITVQVRTAGTTTVVGTYNTTLAADGTFSLTVTQSGTYDIAIKASHWLKAKVANVTLGGGNTAIGSVSLINGDVNGDNVINASDQTALTAAFRSTPSSANWNANADLNGNSQVTATDQAILGKNFGKTGA